MVWADCGGKSPGSRRESHVKPAVAEKLSPETGRVGAVSWRIVT